MTNRKIKKIIAGRQTSDGAGVKLLRTLGQSAAVRLDPFLMLDEFSSENADDYSAGFPSHPHRGFETVTYMLDGHMLHEDHMGNQGNLRAGDVQWMTAARGIIHSEMPQQKEGRMRGFQLWVNLPAAEKMKPAQYRDISASVMPWHQLSSGASIKLIAGTIDIDGHTYEGAAPTVSTEPLYVDISIPADSGAIIPVTLGHNAFVYVFEGGISIGGEPVPQHSAAVLSDGASVSLHSGEQGGRLLLIAGKPIGEPIAQYGPFVMNTQAEIDQALRDYRDGTLAR
ncbi:MAG: pirin family protein [Gammaproteobacteria bacterium]|jgi:redox-sensitive bicupin YhaK (pirin superfamily)|nr:pirin family protein [Gammaproteobacteria bacterium]MBQ0774918.1 pirin family protein [Gammaproteobacteria bacterium]